MTPGTLILIKRGHQKDSIYCKTIQQVKAQAIEWRAIAEKSVTKDFLIIFRPDTFIKPAVEDIAGRIRVLEHNIKLLKTQQREYFKKYA